MPLPHILLAFLVMLIWGINFLSVKIGLDEISPLLLCGLRFFFASIPAVFFVQRPSGPFYIVILYGFVMFALQFSLLFLGLKAGMTPGMASLLMQTQVFFSLFFAVFFLNEKLTPSQVLGAGISFLGIGLVALHLDNTITAIGFVLILSAAASWGLGNLITKKSQTHNTMSLVIWSSFVACIPMLLLSLLLEGPSQILMSYHHVTWKGITALLYIVYASTWIGYGLWNYLLAKYPVGLVAPFTLLVPVVGILSSVIALGEPFQLWKLIACLLVISGLCINLIGTRFFAARRLQAA